MKGYFYYLAEIVCVFLKNTLFTFDQLVVITANKISSIISMMVEFITFVGVFINKLLSELLVKTPTRAKIFASE